MTLIVNPAAVIKDIMTQEAQEGVADEFKILHDEATWNENTEEGGINADIPVAFTVHEKQINSKKLIEGIASNCRLLPYIKDNVLFFQGIKPDPNTADDLDFKIESSDIISYKNSRTAPEKISSKVIVKYHYDYSLKEFTKNTLDDNTNPDNATEYFTLFPQNYNDSDGDGTYSAGDTILSFYELSNLGLDTEQELIFDAHYIRDDISAQALQEFLLLWHCNQHNILKLRLPLKYIKLKIGDYIGFDKPIGGLKLFGEDYSLISSTVFRNGQQILPLWMITSTNKTLTHIDVEAIQMHNCSPNPIAITDYLSGCTDPTATNYNPDATIDDGSCVYTPVNMAAPVCDSFTMNLVHQDFGGYQQTHVDNENPAVAKIALVAGEHEYFKLQFSVLGHDTDGNDLDSVVFLNPFFIPDYYMLYDEASNGLSSSSTDFNHEEFLLDIQEGDGYGNGITEEGHAYSNDTLFYTTYIGVFGSQNQYGSWLVNWLASEEVTTGSYISLLTGTLNAKVRETATDELYESPPIVYPKLINIYKNSLPEAGAITTVHYHNGFNLVGLPEDGLDEGFPLFNGAIADTCFSWDGSTYIQEPYPYAPVPAYGAQNDGGYWLRFEDGTGGFWSEFELNFPLSFVEPKYLSEGWNLVSFMHPVEVPDLYDPDNIIVPGATHGFDGTYFPTNSLMPGKGYWMRCNADGYIERQGAD